MRTQTILRTAIVLVATLLPAVPTAAQVDRPLAGATLCWTGARELDFRALRPAVRQARQSRDAVLTDHLVARLTEAIGSDATRAGEVVGWAQIGVGPHVASYLQAVKDSHAASDPRVVERLLGMAEQHPEVGHRAAALTGLESQPSLDAAALGRLAELAKRGRSQTDRLAAIRAIGRVMENDYAARGRYRDYYAELLDIAAGPGSSAARYLALEMGVYPAAAWDEATADRLIAILEKARSRPLRRLAAHVLSTAADTRRVLRAYGAAFGRESDVCQRNALVHFAFRAAGASALPWLKQAAAVDPRFRPDVAFYSTLYAFGTVDFDRVFATVEALHPECTHEPDDDGLFEGPPSGDTVAATPKEEWSAFFENEPPVLMAAPCEVASLVSEIQHAREPAYRAFVLEEFARVAFAQHHDVLLSAFRDESDPSAVEGLARALVARANAGQTAGEDPAASLGAIASRLRAGGSGETRAGMVRALRALWEPSVMALPAAGGPAYEQLMADPAFEVRAAAAANLRAEAGRDVSRRPAVVRGTVSALMASGDPRAAAEVLGALSLEPADAVTIGRVADLLTGGRTPALRVAAARALGTVDGPHAPNVLATLSGHYGREGSRDVRAAVVEALARAGRERALPLFDRLRGIDPALDPEIVAWRTAVGGNRHTWQLLSAEQRRLKAR